MPFARYDHDAYGNPTRTLTAATAALDAVTAAAIAERNVLRYAGYAFDAHSGLYYLSQRYCDPATCHFITKDPAKADGEESAYQYCGGDPVGKVDPSGEAQTVILAVPKYEAQYCCWSGAVRSWLKHTTGTWVSELTLVKDAFGGKYPGSWKKSGVTTDKVQRVIEKHGMRADLLNRPLTWSELKAQIASGRAVYVAWEGGGGHAVIIRGFSESGKTQEVHYFCSSYNEYYTETYTRFVNKDRKYANWHTRKFRWKRTLWNARKS